MKKIVCLLMAGILASGSLFAQTYSTELEKKANGGDTEAMIQLGDAYFKGNGTKQDAKKAEKWYKNAIKKNNIKGYSKIAELYSTWDGLEKNPEKQEKWQLKAAEAGDPEWANFYGNKYFDQKAYGKAGTYYETAIKGGATDCYGKLAFCQMINQKLFDALKTAEKIGANIKEKGSDDYYGDQARKRAYAQLGRHDLVGTLTGDDLIETVIYCTGLKLPALKGNEIKILETLKEVEFSGRTPEFLYLKGIAAFFADKKDLMYNCMKQAYDKGFENAGVALYGMTIKAPGIYGYKGFIADDPLLNIMASSDRFYGSPDFSLIKPFEKNITSNLNLLANKPDLQAADASKYSALNSVRRRFARNGNVAALEYFAKGTGKSAYDLAKEMNCMEAVAQRGYWWAITDIYKNLRESNSDPDKTAYWRKCMHIAIPLNSAANCSYLYQNIYKNYGDNGIIEFVGSVMDENPDYLIQWVSQDDKLRASEKVSILRMAAADTTEANRDKIDKVLRDDFGTTL